MEKVYEDSDVEGLTEEQAQRLVDRVIELGHTEAEAYVMNATCGQRRSE